MPEYDYLLMPEYYRHELTALFKRVMPASFSPKQQASVRAAMRDDFDVHLLNMGKNLLSTGRVEELEAKYPYEDTGLRGSPPGPPVSSPIMSAGTLPPVYAMSSPITKLGEELYKAGEIGQDELISLQDLVQGTRAIAGKMVAQARGEEIKPNEPGQGPSPGRGGGGRGR